MADFRTDTSAIKVEKQQGMSLADMLNISKSSYELSKLKELYPAMIQKEQALSKSAQIGANLAEQTSPLELQSKQQSTESAGIDLMTKKQQKIADGYVSKIFDPMIVNAAKNPNSINKDELVKNITQWGIQQGKEAGVDQEATMKLIQPYIDIAQNNPAQLQDYLKQRHILGLSPESRTGAMTPSGIAVNTGAGGATVNTNPFAGMPPGQAIPGTTFKQELGPARTDISNVKGTVDSNGNFIPFNSSESSNKTENKTVEKEKPELITNETKVLSAGGVPQLNDQQKTAYDEATAEKRKYKDITENVSESEKTIKTALDKLSASKASAPGRLLRSAGRWAEGNEDLDILTKSLADIAVRQTKLMGAGTDASQEAVNKTQGNVDLTEGGLRSILQRVSATNTAWNDYLTATQKYENKRGPYANVNHEQFKKAWASNYDTNVFILQNIHDSNLPETQKQLEISKLFKVMSASEIEKFRTKAKNIDALMKGEYK